MQFLCGLRPNDEYQSLPASAPPPDFSLSLSLYFFFSLFISPALSIAATAAKQSTAIARSARSFSPLGPSKFSQRKFVNLPGWCWAEIQQFALVGSSSSLHSEACNALGASDGVIHSRISQEVVCLRATTNTSLCDNDFRPFHVKHARFNKKRSLFVSLLVSCNAVGQCRLPSFEMPSRHSPSSDCTCTGSLLK